MNLLLRNHRAAGGRNTQVFLDIFSGVGGLAAALRQRGFLVLDWDILHGPAWDLLKPSNQKLIRGWIAEGVVWGVHLGTPCQSFTRARDRGPIKQPGQKGWPSRLRSDAYVWGLPELVNPPDILAVEVGNRLARFSISVLNTCRVHAIPCTVENPAGSRLWLLPGFKLLARHARWREIITHYCMWGKPWKKPTRFAGLFLDLLPVERLCRGRAVCCRTGCTHQSLQGTSPSGVMWTKVAEPYPRPMCNTLARCFEEAHATLRTRALGSLLAD
jgi:hypothetical protein